MKQAEVLIAVGDDRFSLALRVAVERRADMRVSYCTGCGKDALEYLQAYPVDILFLEMELNEGHGMFLLEELMADGGTRPLILVMSAVSSPSLACGMRVCGVVDYMCKKEENLFGVLQLVDAAGRLYPYKCMLERREQFAPDAALTGAGEDVLTRRLIEQRLLQMGFSKRYMGFSYIVDALELMAQYELDEPVQFSKEIYPRIAGKYRATTNGVERAIRSALHAVFSNESTEKLWEFYPYPYDRRVGRPSNADFLVNLSVGLRSIYQSRQ